MIKVKVCIGSACHLKGSYDVITAFNNLIDERGLEDDVELGGVFCLGHCVDAVSVQIGDEVYSVSASSVPEFFDEHVAPALT